MRIWFAYAFWTTLLCVLWFNLINSVTIVIYIVHSGKHLWSSINSIVRVTAEHILTTIIL